MLNYHIGTSFLSLSLDRDDPTPTFLFTNHSFHSLFSYTVGDSTDSGIGREVYVQLTCGGSSPASATQFQQAPEKPPPPHGKPYTYYLFVQSKYEIPSDNNVVDFNFIL